MSLLLIAGILISGLPTAAQEAVFVIRHAQQEAWNDPDPPLTDQGRLTAQRWAVVLKDAGVDMVFTSEARRTIETGKNIADAMGVPVVQMPKWEIEALVERIRSEHPGDVVLVVGHSGSIPTILRQLGSRDTLLVEETDYNSLFIVVPVDETSSTVQRLQIP